MRNKKFPCAVRGDYWASLFRAGVVLAMLCLGTNLGQSADWYVAASGNDTLGGSLSQPFRTIQRAIGLARPGDTVNVMAGEYAEELRVATDVGAAGGTATMPIMLRSHEGGAVHVRVLQKGWKHYALYVGQPFWIVDGFIFHYRIQIAGSDTILRNCEVDCSGWESSYPAAIWVLNADDVLIQGCRIHDYFTPTDFDHDAHGIFGENTKNLTVRNNEMWKNQGDHIQMAPFSAWQNLLVEGNHFWTGPEAAIEGRSPGENAVDLKGNSGGGTVTIRGNRIHGFRGGTEFGSGFGTGSGSGGEALVQRGVLASIIIEENEIYDCDSGIYFHANADSDVPGGTFPNVTIRRNLIHHMNTARAGGGVYCPTVFYINTWSTVAYDVASLSIVNNTVADFAGVLFGGSNRVQSGSIRNNIFFRVSVPFSVRSGSWGSFGYNLWSDSPYPSSPVIVGATDIVGRSPGFVNPTLLDYHLTTGSPAIDVGTDVGLPSLGRPDMGAFEFGMDVGVPVAPPTDPRNVRMER